jgi:hypothetical protein
MQGSEFEQYFKFFPNLKRKFKGIFSIDTIPKSLALRQFCIINTDLSINSGRHWFVMFKISKSCLEVFDSLGIDSEKEISLKNYCKMKINHLNVNLSKFQSNDSVNCGLFCVFYIIHR